MADAFTEDLVALLPNLRRFALSLCRQGDIADDLVQLTAEKAFAARDSYDPDTRMDAWLFRILRNAWIDMVRRDKTRGVSVDVDDAPEAATVDGRDIAENRMALGEAGKAIQTLPPDQRQVLLAVCVEGLSYADAAERLGVPKGTVMSRLSRARLALAEKLGIK